MNKSTENLSGLSDQQRELLRLRLSKLSSRTKSGLSSPRPRAEQRDTFPVSFAQQRLWFLSQWNPASPAYNSPVYLRLLGPLDAGSLCRALEGLVGRHEILRTRFDCPEDQPFQVVQGAEIFRVDRLDLGDLPEPEREPRLATIAREEVLRPFQLQSGPVFRAMLVRLQSEAHALLMTAHHIVFDGWSVGILLRELSELYEAARQGRAPQLPPLKVQFPDYALWQREGMEGEVLERQLEYWRKQLERAAPVLDLPLDRPRAADQPYNSALFKQPLAPGLTPLLQTYCQTHELTQFAVLCAAYMATLFRLSAQEDILVGTVTSGRNCLEIEPLIGFFVNTLVLRTAVRGDMTFRQLTGAVRETSLGAFAHQDIPFEKLVEELRPGRSPQHSPFFQTAFSLQNTPRQNRVFSDLQLRPLEFVSDTVKFDLELRVTPTERGIHCAWGYNRNLLEKDTIRRWAESFQVLLEGALQEPGRPLHELPFVPPETRQLILQDWGMNRAPYPREKGLAELFEEAAARRAGAIAVEAAGRKLTYGQLNARANRLAHFLKQQGIGPDRLVAVYLERGPELMTALLAVIKAGGAYLPLDEDYPPERLAFMVEDADASAVLTRRDSAGRLPGASSRTICLDDPDVIRRVREQSPDNPPRSAQGGHLAYVVYTSGSTGRPKGVCVPQRAVSRLVLGTDYVSLRADDVMAQASNVSFDAATFEIWGAWLHGAKLLIIDKECVLSPRHFQEQLTEGGVTTLFLTTALFNQLAGECPGAFRNLRHLLFGGELVDPHWVRTVLDQGPPGRLVHVYGPTECTTYATWHEVEKVPMDAATVPIGRPLANTECYVLDRWNHPVPPGVVGELFLGGDGLARGYLNRPELTAEKFVDHPFQSGEKLYRTGDLVRWNKQGQLEFVGRRDQQVKLRGFRIELGEIEAALRRHESVSEAVVVVRGEGSSGRHLAGYLVPSTPEHQPTAGLKTFLKDKLPEFMVPPVLVWLESLPLNPNGKIDKAALPEPGPESPSSRHTPPRSQLERRIARVWQEVLGLERIGLGDNFFDLGGHSLLLVKAQKLLKRELGCEVRIVELFQYATVEQLARHLSGETSAPSVSAPVPASDRSTRDIAIIGLAGRFPGARNVHEFWNRLREGSEMIRQFSEEELFQEGWPADLLRQDDFVKAKGVLDDVEWFDAAFFGYSPREAQVIDPQQRLFLECAWEALENAGQDPQQHGGRIGVFAGQIQNTYWYHLMADPHLAATVSGFQMLISNDKDFLPTRVSYKLDLKGPSLNVQTACSTSLVAVHLACRSLWEGECDMALAGGVSVSLPVKGGYRYIQEGIGSPDGHCRAFDEQAAGTVISNGLGVVVLKPLAAALREGDRILAIIKGSAINNDGALKVGYTAPSVTGQAEVIRSALRVAGVEPGTIGYVETHGTATKLGDPIEIEGLKQAFGKSGEGHCALGSLKTNVGHMDAAAGVGGLIKTALALEHGEIPPSLHYHRANPRIEFEGSPFYVNRRRQAWPRKAGKPRRAGVSSFGIGGTNAHVVLEEGPEAGESGESRPWQLLVWSARQPRALEEMTGKLGEHLKGHEQEKLADVAWTLQQGRHGFERRRMMVSGSREEALEGLEGGRGWEEGQAGEQGGGVVMMFSGQGSQYAGMGRGLYEREGKYREEVDRCAEHLMKAGHEDVRRWLLAEGKDEQARKELKETRRAQPALFVVEYALARLWESWGIRVQGMIGHSLGEYVAACLAGVMSLEEGLELVAERGRLMGQMAPGGMSAVLGSEEEVRGWMRGRELSLAAVNGPGLCVVSGEGKELEGWERELEKEGVGWKRLETSHAFHSAMMEPMLGAFEKAVARIELKEPRRRYVSNLTGRWIEAGEARDPGYWVKHLRQTVRFGEGLERVLEEKAVLLEVGPGGALSQMARRRPQAGPVVGSLPKAGEEKEDQACLLESLGRLWIQGVEVDWKGFQGKEKRRKVELPGYPFQRQKYWVEPGGGKDMAQRENPRRKKDIDQWFYVPAWHLSPMPRITAPEKPHRWLIFLDEFGLAESMIRQLLSAGQEVVRVAKGEAFAEEGKHFTLRPGDPGDYNRLRDALTQQGWSPDYAVHAWSLSREGHPLRRSDWPRVRQEGFECLLHLGRTLGAWCPEGAALVVLTSGLHDVRGEVVCHPESAILLGPVRVLPLEYAKLRTRCVDLEACQWTAGNQALETCATRLIAECLSPRPENLVAHRAGRRWVQHYVAENLEPARENAWGDLREDGVWLVTGGLGGIGFALAEALVERGLRKLILLGRRGLPERPAWNTLLQEEPGGHLAAKIRKLLSWEEKGVRVHVAGADVADARQTQDALQQAEQILGPVTGVVHAAGVAGGGLVELKKPEDAALVLRPKVDGLLVLEELLAGRELDLLVLCSSLTAVLGGVGQVDYCGANAFLDAYARRGAPYARQTVSINWDTWNEAGMALETRVPEEMAAERKAQLLLGMTNAQGVEVLGRILDSGLVQVAVSTTDLHCRRLRRPSAQTRLESQEGPKPTLHERPALQTDYVAPTNEVEESVARVWGELLGLERVGIHDDFVALGGHSLLATQLASRVRREFQVEITLKEIFEQPTVAGISQVVLERWLEQNGDESSARLLEELDQMSDDEIRQQLSGSPGPSTGEQMK